MSAAGLAPPKPATSVAPAPDSATSGADSPPSLQSILQQAGLGASDAIKGAGDALGGAANAVTSTVGAALGGGTSSASPTPAADSSTSNAPPSLDELLSKAGLSPAQMDPTMAAPAAAPTDAGAGVSAATAQPGAPADPMAKAKAFLGQPYVWGGKSPDAGFDCSGLAGYLAGTGQPESTTSLYAKSGQVSATDLRPGDLVFYNMGQSDMHLQHVGTYIGDGKLVQAGGSARTVNVADITQPIGSAPEFRRLGTEGGRPAQADMAPGGPSSATQTTAGLSGGGDLSGQVGAAGQQILSGAAQAASWLGDQGQKAVQSVLVTEGGLNKARGDQGKSAGPLQFYEGGQLANMARDLGVTLEQAKTWVEDNPVKAVQWAIGTPDAPGYLGRAIQDGIQKGLSGADLATYAQQHGQVSESPERAGQNFNALFGGGQPVVSSGQSGDVATSSSNLPDYGAMADRNSQMADQASSMTDALNRSTDQMQTDTDTRNTTINKEADDRLAALRKSLGDTVAQGNAPQAAAQVGESQPIGAAPPPTPPGGPPDSGDQNPLQKWGQQLTQSIVGLIQHISGQPSTGDASTPPVSPVPAPGGGYDPSSMHGPTPPADAGIPARPVGADLPSAPSDVQSPNTGIGAVDVAGRLASAAGTAAQGAATSGVADALGVSPAAAHQRAADDERAQRLQIQIDDASRGKADPISPEDARWLDDYTANQALMVGQVSMGGGAAHGLTDAAGKAIAPIGEQAAGMAGRTLEGGAGLLGVGRDAATAAADAAPSVDAIGGAQGGQVDPRFAVQLGSAAAGGAVGNASTPDNAPPQERAVRIAGGAAAGLGIGSAAVRGSAPGNAKPVTALELFNTAHVGNVISGPATATHVLVNSIIAPAFSGIGRTAADIAGGVAGGVSGGHIPGSISPTEAVGRIQGRGIGVATGLAQMGDAFMAALKDHFDNPSNIANRVDNPVVAGLLRAQQATGSALHATLQTITFEGMKRMELAAQAGEDAASKGLAGSQLANRVAAVLQNPSLLPGAEEKAAEVARRGALRGDAGTIQKRFQDIAKVPFIGNTLFPVVRIASQALAQGIETSPLGLAGTAADVGRFGLAKAGLAAPGSVAAGPYAREAGDIIGGTGLNRIASDAGKGGQPVTPLGDRLTNNIVGTAITALLAGKAMEGAITGNGPNDPDERVLLEAKGWKPHSIFIPGGPGYVDYHVLGRLAVPLAIAGNYADAVNYPDRGKGPQAGTNPNANPDPYEVAGDIAQRVTSYLTDSTGLRTISDLYKLLHGGADAKTALASFGGNTASGFIPESALLRGLVLSGDMAGERQPKRGDIGDVVRQGLPPGTPLISGRDQVPLKRDVEGRVVPNEQAGMGMFMGRRGQADAPTVGGGPGGGPNADPLINEALRLRIADMPVALTAPKTQNYLGAPQTPAQEDTIAKTVGNAVRLYGLTTMSSPNYAGLSDSQKADALSKSLAQAHKAANIQMGDEIARDPHNTALMLWSETPQYTGVRGAPAEVAAQNFAVAEAKTKLAQYKKVLGEAKGQMRMRQDDPNGYRLAQRERLDTDRLTKLKAAIDAASGGALLHQGSSAAAGGVFDTGALDLEPPA